MGVTDDAVTVARRLLEAEADVVRSVTETIGVDFVQIAALILSCNGKLFIGGSGTSGAVAHRMAHVLSVSGTPSIAFSPADSLHGASGAIGSSDLVLLISNGGASNEVIESAKVAQQRGAKVIAITKSHDTKLGRIANYDVELAADPRAEMGGIIATGSSLMQSAWGDALAEVLRRARGYTWKEFISTHPAGAVGQIKDFPEDPEVLVVAPEGEARRDD